MEEVWAVALVISVTWKDEVLFIGISEVAADRYILKLSSDIIGESTKIFLYRGSTQPELAEYTFVPPYSMLVFVTYIAEKCLELLIKLK